MGGKAGTGPGDGDGVRLEVSMIYWNWLEIWRETRLGLGMRQGQGWDWSVVGRGSGVITGTSYGSCRKSLRAMPARMLMMTLVKSSMIGLELVKKMESMMMRQRQKQAIPAKSMKAQEKSSKSEEGKESGTLEWMSRRQG